MRRLKEGDALSAPEFLGRNPPAHLSIRITYRCRKCGQSAEVGIQVEAVQCVKCGSRMRPVV